METMGDEVNNQPGQAAKLSKNNLELKPSNALNGKSLSDNQAAPSDTNKPDKKVDSAELKLRLPIKSAEESSVEAQPKVAKAEAKSLEAQPKVTEAQPQAAAEVPVQPVASGHEPGKEARHLAPPLPADEQEKRQDSSPRAGANLNKTKEESDKINPWVSFICWKKLLCGLFKTALFLVVVVSAIIFGTVLGVTVYRTYFAIPDEIEVPAIEGKDFAVANEMLKKVGLRLRIEEGRHNTKFPDRIIISQEPPRGRVVRQNREILAVVSLGPEQYKVPDLKGLSLREVKKSLNNNKLYLGKVTYTPKNANRPDEVLEQKPLAGTLALKGTKVNVVLNQGLGMAKVSVPDCCGRALGRVGPVLKKAGLNLGKVVWSVSERPVGEVLSQNPPSGAAVMSDSEVALEVSAGSSSSRILVHHKLEIFLPGGNEPSEVRVVLLSPEGEEEVYRASHVVNDVVTLWVTGPRGSDAEVYLNDKLFMRDKL